eukprot:1161507-Pelagomonas_calceolata.AAC.7
MEPEGIKQQWLLAGNLAKLYGHPNRIIEKTTSFEHALALKGAIARKLTAQGEARLSKHPLKLQPYHPPLIVRRKGILASHHAASELPTKQTSWREAYSWAIHCNAFCLVLQRKEWPAFGSHHLCPRQHECFH